MTFDFILYSDFNCPFCYAFSERIIALGFADRIGWRGVQHAPHLQMPMAHAGPTFASELAREVQFVQRLAPEVSIALPREKPNTGPAILAVAAAMNLNPHKAHRLATLLYRMFWQHGADISTPSVIRNVADQADFPIFQPHLRPSRPSPYGMKDGWLGGLAACRTSFDKMVNRSLGWSISTHFGNLCSDVPC